MTQKQRVLDYLEQGNKFTPLDSWHAIGVMQPARRICELRKEGYDIKGPLIEVTNRWGETVRVAEYSMEVPF